MAKRGETVEVPSLFRTVSYDLDRLAKYQWDLESSLDALPQFSFYETLRAGFHSPMASVLSEAPWVQIDLGFEYRIDSIAIFPTLMRDGGQIKVGYGFPRELRVEASSDPNFVTSYLVASYSTDEESPLGVFPCQFGALSVQARYVRVICTQPRNTAPPFFWSLGEIMVLSGELNVAQWRPVSTNGSLEADLRWSARYLVDGFTSHTLPVGLAASPTYGYRSATTSVSASNPHTITIDLNETLPIQFLELFTARPPDQANVPGWGFPSKFKVELATAADFSDATVIYRMTDSLRHWTDQPLGISVASRAYFTGTRRPMMLWEPAETIASEPVMARFVRVVTTETDERISPAVVALSEVRVFSDFKNVALGAAVATTDSAETEPSKRWSASFLTDGFESRFKLLTLPQWLDAAERRRVLERDLELSRATLRTGIRSMSSRLWSSVLIIAAIVFAIVGLHTWFQRRQYVQRTERMRQQIANDLHDDIGSNLGTIALLGETLIARDDLPRDVKHDLLEIRQTVDETSGAMREILWLIQPTPVTLDEFVAQLRSTANRMLHQLETHFIAPPQRANKHAELDWRRSVFLSFKEILHNVVKHSQATQVTIRVSVTANSFKIDVRDNGVGFDDDASRSSNDSGVMRHRFGLLNLKSRAESYGGELTIASEQGTTITLSVPFSQTR